jgi:hypothetical protein
MYLFIYLFIYVPSYESVDVSARFHSVYYSVAIEDPFSGNKASGG